MSVAHFHYLVEVQGFQYRILVDECYWAERLTPDFCASLNVLNAGDDGRASPSELVLFRDDCGPLVADVAAMARRILPRTCAPRRAPRDCFRANVWCGFDARGAVARFRAELRVAGASEGKGHGPCPSTCEARERVRRTKKGSSDLGDLVQRGSDVSNSAESPGIRPR